MEATPKIKYLYVDEDSIDPDLLCCICTNPLIDPIEHTSCGKEICEICLLENDLKSCPICSGPLNKDTTKIVTAKRLLNPLNSLKTACPTCSQHFERIGLYAHVEICPVPCSCKEMIRPKDLKQHKETDCPEEIIGCEATFCKWRGKRSDPHNESCIYRQLTPLISHFEKQIAALQLELNEKSKQIKNLTAENAEMKQQITKKCMYCKNAISFFNNSQCTSYHPSAANERMVHPCCGKAFRAEGCQRRSHQFN